jgi:hypothetical protein
MEDKESYSPKEVAEMCLAYARMCRDPTDKEYKKGYSEVPINVKDNLPLGRLEEII